MATMSLPSPKSPKWRKPTIMRVRKHARTSSNSIPSAQRVVSTIDTANAKCQSPSMKRKNPFKSDCHSKRRPSVEVSGVTQSSPEQNQSSTSTLLQLLNSSEKFFEDDSLDSFSLQTKDISQSSPKSKDISRCSPKSTAVDHSSNLLHPPFFDRNRSLYTDQSNVPSLSDADQSAETRSEVLPCDWSIKTKIRFLSRASLDWCADTRSSDVAGGVATFINHSCQVDKDHIQVQAITKEVAFQQAVQYWCHPNLPWIRHFPRILPENKVRKPSLLDDEMKTALKSDWFSRRIAARLRYCVTKHVDLNRCESMTSIFYLLRHGYASHFYVCTHQFTCLFVAAVSDQGRRLQAVISPTTRGLREALASEGINFSLPLFKDDMKGELDGGVDDTSGETATGAQMGAGDEDDDECDTAAGAWLESMGLDRENFPTLDPSKVKLQRDSFRSIDNRAESTVLVDDPDVQGTFNFLLNWRSCFSLSGSQVGVPPTILSSCPFKGGTLHSLRCKKTTAKQEDAQGRLQTIDVVEISGPALPTNVSRLCRLFARTQDCYAASFVTHEPTSVINKVINTPLNHDKTSDAHIKTTDSCRDVSTNSRKGANCDESHVLKLKPATFKSIEYRDKLFTWVT